MNVFKHIFKDKIKTLQLKLSDPDSRISLNNSMDFESDSKSRQVIQKIEQDRRSAYERQVKALEAAQNESEQLRKKMEGFAARST